MTVERQHNTRVELAAGGFVQPETIGTLGASAETHVNVRSGCITNQRDQLMPSSRRKIEKRTCCVDRGAIEV